MTLDNDLVTSSMVDAQRAAEKELDDERKSSEAEKENNVVSDELAPVPKLLQLAEAQGANARTVVNDLKQRGQQLDLLLMKAESYSKFIMQNQAMQKASCVSSSSSSSSGSKGKKREGIVNGSSPSGGKRAKDTNGRACPSPPAQPSDETDTPLMEQPKTLTGGELMSYQREGLQWLVSLWENGLSGILADEMGLGKTIQVISLIAQVMEKGVTGPFIIIGPLATLPNWVNEFKKWLPSVDVMLYHGSKAEREELRRTKMKKMNQKTRKFPIIISSFEICMIDRPHLEHYEWTYMVLDEGHRIKNRDCRLVKELKKIPSTSRLLLTGTPIQNTLEELWSLLNFVNPMIFDDLEVFQSWFGFRNIGGRNKQDDTQVDDIMKTEQETRVVSKLHEVLRPFLLRRMKKDVLIDMPPKAEVIVYCGMSALQKEYYAHVHNDTIRKTLVDMKIDNANNTSQINKLMNLRKVCNHPFLFGEPKDERGRYLSDVNGEFISMASGKFRFLDRILPRLKKQGHKVLVFSQMTELLGILQDYCTYNDYSHCRLDGSTKVQERQEMIDTFNNDKDMFLFMLSTRAGGLGINLAAASTVIIFDSDWNPHLDTQAQDRAHRIGQKVPVVVYRLLTAGSMEIEMLEKQISKKKLERMTIRGGDYSKAGYRSEGNLTVSKLRKLLEDDVANLARMASQGVTKMTKGAFVSDAELDMIMDRDRLFLTLAAVGTDTVVDSPLPLEGEMYDVVTTTAADAGALGTIS